VVWLDVLIPDLTDRFSTENSIIAGGIHLIPQLFVEHFNSTTRSGASQPADVVSNCIDTVVNAAKHFNQFNVDSDDSIKISKLAVQLRQWFSYWQGVEHHNQDRGYGKLARDIFVPDSLQSVLLCREIVLDLETYSEIRKLAHLLAVLPLTTCTCERCISMLRRVKTYLRSTMEKERLNDLCIIHASGEAAYEIPIGEIIDEFAARAGTQRRMILTFPSSS